MFFEPMRFEGEAQLLRALADIKRGTARRKQIKILKAAAEPVRLNMARLAPRGQGSGGDHLADSMVIMTVRGSAASRAEDVTVAVGPSKDKFYGFFLQYGTVHISPTPFASQGLEAGTKPAFRILAAGYWELIRKAFKPPSTRRRRRS